MTRRHAGPTTPGTSHRHRRSDSHHEHHHQERNADEAQQDRRGRGRSRRDRARARRLLQRGHRPTATPPDGGDGELTPVTLQLQWLTQAQFGGYYLAGGERATGRTSASTSRSSPARSTSCRRTCSPPATSTSRSRGCRRRSLDRGRREHHQHRADLRAQRRRCRSRGPTAASPAPTTSRASRSAAGASATSGSSSRASPRRTPSGYTIVQQNFDMNALLNRRDRRRAGDDLQRVRAAARGRRTPRPASSTSPRTSRSSTGTRSARRCCRTRSGPTPSGSSPTRSTRDTAVKLIQGAILGLDRPARRPAGRGRRGHRRRLDARHEPPALDGQRDQQADLAVDRAASATSTRTSGTPPSRWPSPRRTRTAHRSSPPTRPTRRTPTSTSTRRSTTLEGRRRRRHGRGLRAHRGHPRRGRQLEPNSGGRVAREDGASRDPLRSRYAAAPAARRLDHRYSNRKAAKP